MLGQGGFAGAVMPQHGHEGPLRDFQIYPVQHHRRDGPLVGGVGKAELLRFDNGLTHMHSLRFSRIPTAPWRRRAGKGQWR